MSNVIVIGMRLSKDDAAKNRQAIVKAASRLFRERGYDAVGLNELMAEAGFTRGGFYNHFDSKEALAEEVLRDTFDHHGALLTTGLAEAVRTGNDDPLGAKLLEFLSPRHRDDAANGCPTASMAMCSAHFGEAVQGAFVDGLETYISTFAGELEGTDDERREKAGAILAQIVGAVVLSRAVVRAKPALADELLEASKSAADELRGKARSKTRPARRTRDARGKKEDARAKIG